MADGFEKLAWRNRFVKELSQQIEGADCFVPFAYLNPDSNLIVLDLTEAQFTRMFSALITGADITYPDESHQIQVDFLKGLHCPPDMSEQECVEYPTYASFIQYQPMNPFIEPNTIPDGYLTQPFLVDGQNGNDIPNLEPNDIYVPLDSITLDFNWFEDISGQLPTITIMVQGEGKAFIKMLNTPAGGLAVITLDNPPNLADILAGIVTGAENIIDLNQDLVSLPPETAIEQIFPLDIVGTGMHTIYIVFLPILDDSLVPLRFGGGFRGVQLCDFVENPAMGITALRVEDCNLEQQLNGEWTVVNGWEDFLANCLPSGGGGGVAAFKTTTYDIELGANQDTNSTSMVQAAGTVQEHQYVYSNALIFAECQLSNTNAGANAFFQVRNNGALSAAGGIQRVGGNVGEVLYVSGSFTSLDKVNPSNISIYFRASANTARIGTGSRVLYTILEFENASDLESMFVQDIQYAGGILQKKIDGVWLNVVDIAALLAPISAAANNANAVNTTQNSQISSLVSVNNAQNTLISTLNSQMGTVIVKNTEQDVRLDVLEADVADLTLSVAQHNLDIDNLQNSIGVLSAGGVWSWYHDMLTALPNYSLGSAGTGWTLGQGWLSNVNGLQLLWQGDLLYQNQITHIQCEVVYNSAPTGSSRWRVNGGDFASFRYAGVGVSSFGWYRLPNRADQQLNIEFQGSGNFRLVSLRYLGRGNDNPFD